MTKQTPRHRKALRSAAAMDRHREARQASMRPVMLFADEMPPPDPTPATPNWLHRIWAKIAGR